MSSYAVPNIGSYFNPSTTSNTPSASIISSTLTNSKTAILHSKMKASDNNFGTNHRNCTERWVIATIHNIEKESCPILEKMFHEWFIFIIARNVKG